MNNSGAIRSSFFRILLISSKIISFGRTIHRCPFECNPCLPSHSQYYFQIILHFENMIWWKPNFLPSLLRLAMTTASWRHMSKGDCLLFLEHQIAHWGLLHVLRKLRNDQTGHWEGLSLKGSKPNPLGHGYIRCSGHLAGKIFSFSLVSVHRLIRICKNLHLHCQVQVQTDEPWLLCICISLVL